MEGSTPAPPPSGGTQGRSTAPSIAPSNPTGPRALIVRMPDSTHYAGVRRWVDRREVDEMIMREASRRRDRKYAVEITQYASPNPIRLENGMDLYFVGHGGMEGFVLENSRYYGADDLREWIKTRADSSGVQLNKIKLVTCNAGKGKKYSFAADLANALRGVATGKVVGFSGYLLSALDAKAIYGEEPQHVNTEAHARYRTKETELKGIMRQKFADMLAPGDKKVSEDGVKWAKAVICSNETQFDALLKGVSKGWISKEQLIDKLKDIKASGVAWPDDLEDMIRTMRKKNETISSAVAQEAEKLFAEWGGENQFHRQRGMGEAQERNHRALRQ